MTYTLNRIRGKRGEVLKDIKGAKGVTLDIDKNRVALVFLGENVIAEMKVMEFEAHAMGLYLRGTEKAGVDKLMYQEWFLKYEA